jgi:nuclear GTP-binding protein
MRRIYLIDCPGIVPPSARDTETQKVLKGVVRVEHLSAPGDSIPTLLARVRPEYMQRTYGIESWTDSEDFLTQLAVKRGKLGKGGEANLDTVAKMVLNDWIRGKIPYFVRPPEAELPAASAQASTSTQTIEEQELAAAKAQNDEKAFGTGRVAGVVQPLHQIVSRTRFVGEDKDNADDGEEWTGFGSADPTSDAPEVVENDIEAEDGAEASIIEAELDNTVADEDASSDAGDLAWEDLVGESLPKPATSSPRKRPAVDEEPAEDVVDDNEEDEAEEDTDRRHSKKKEKRMTTNKKKAENFFTHNNVKGRNRDRKIPKVERRKKR